MRIGIDLSFLCEKKVGVDFYTFNILKHIAKLDTKNEYILYSCRRIPEEFVRLSEINRNFVFKPSPNRSGFRLFWTRFILPGILKRDGIDVFHAPCFWGPARCPCPMVITFFDMTSWLLPRLFTLKHRLFYAGVVPSLAGKASHLIAISENSARDMVKIFGIPRERIDVVYGAAEDIFKPVKDRTLVDKIKMKYNISSDYILYVGILEPRKNLPLLIRAFNWMVKDKNAKHRLVIAGRKGWGWKDIFRLVRKKGLEDKVVFTDYVEEKDLVPLYNGASVFVYPSLYEGFGLPPLEAMACGAPVVSSDVSSLPEVVGDAGILVNPYEKEELAKSIYEVINNPELKKKMISKGIERAKKFSWQTAARKTLALYEDVVRKP